MNAIVTAFAEQGLVLGAILLLAIYLQAKIHNESTTLRKDMSDMKDDLRKDMSDMKDDLRKDMSDMKDDLRKDMSDMRDSLRKEMSEMRDSLRKEMSEMKDDLRKDMSKVKDDLHNEMKSQGTRLARVEGVLSRGVAHEAVAEQPSGEGSQPK